MLILNELAKPSLAMCLFVFPQYLLLQYNIHSQQPKYDKYFLWLYLGTQIILNQG